MRRSAHSKLQQAGITLTCNRDPLIRAVGETAEDPLANQDLLIWAAGSRAGSLYRESGLPIDPGGFLQVEATLQSTAHPNIFGAGDCISLKDHPELPKVGVYAIRQAPVLCDNIESYIRNKPLRRFKPQTQFLSILNSAHKTAILQWRGVTMSGRANLIERHRPPLMRRYQITAESWDVQAALTHSPWIKAVSAGRQWTVRRQFPPEGSGPANGIHDMHNKHGDGNSLWDFHRHV